MHPPHRITTPQHPGAQVRGQLGEPRRKPGRIPGRQLPHHPHPAACRWAYSTATLVLPAPPSPHSTTTPGPGPRPPAGQPARPAAPPGPPGTPAAAPAAPPLATARPSPPAPRPLAAAAGSVSAWNSASPAGRGSPRLDRDPRLLHLVPERALPLPIRRIGKEQARQRQDRVLIQHEYQPRHAQHPGLRELQLRIGKHRARPGPGSRTGTR